MGENLGGVEVGEAEKQKKQKSRKFQSDLNWQVRQDMNGVYSNGRQKESFRGQTIEAEDFFVLYRRTGLLSI